MRADAPRVENAVLTIFAPRRVVPFNVKSFRIRKKLRQEIRNADGDQNFLARLDPVALKFERLRRVAYDARRHWMQPQGLQKRAAECPHVAQFLGRGRAMAERLIDLSVDLCQQLRLAQQLVNKKRAGARRGVEA